MKVLTVNDLKLLCEEQIRKGNGNKKIMISQDDEGNGFHFLFYAFTKPEDVLLERCEINETIAKYEDIIILG